MNRSAWIVSSFAAITIACGGGTAKTAQQGADNKATAEGNITVAGCLARADEMPGSIGTSGSATAVPPAGAERFVLRQAQPIGASSPSSAVGTSGSGSSYSLDGDVAELRSHAGQQVEVLGRVDAAASDPSGQRLIVTSVRTVADTCANP